jgi:hypothetical protein
MDLQKLVHELSVHQIELELQNEELRKSREQLEKSRSEYAALHVLQSLPKQAQGPSLPPRI